MFKKEKSIIIYFMIFTILFVGTVKIDVSASDSINYDGVLRTINCKTVAEIQNALKDARAGDRIIIAEGDYVGKWMNNGFYYSNASGTKENPIIIESENKDKKSKLAGAWNSGAVLTIEGSNWIINNLAFTKSQKGIIIDKGNDNIIVDCEVYDITMEGVHFRDGSSNNLLVNTYIHDTGTQSKGMGEGVYVGSDKGKWNQFIKECDNNIIRNCTIGPNVASESIDIKEGTTGTIVEGCTFIGDGISGENYADSFIDIKGNQAIIKNNTFYRNNNSIIVAGIQIHVQVEGWGVDNLIKDNVFNLDDSSSYILDNSKGTATVSNNHRLPDGNMYKGNNTILDSFQKEDLNKDGKVDFNDISILAIRYNTSQNDSLYNIEYDINLDGIIDLYDLVFISKCIDAI